MNPIGIVVLFVFPMVGTIPLAALICRRRLSRKKRVSYGTVLLTACGIPLLLAFLATCIEPGMWWSSENKNDPVAWRVMLMFMVGMCVLPAFFVVLYYQRRGKLDQLPVVQPDATPSSRPTPPFSPSSEAQTPDSLRPPASGGCG